MVDLIFNLETQKRRVRGFRTIAAGRLDIKISGSPRGEKPAVVDQISDGKKTLALRMGCQGFESGFNLATAVESQTGDS